MNAAVLAQWLHEQPGRRRARGIAALLAQGVVQAALQSTSTQPIDVLLGRWTLDHSPFFVAIDIMARGVSPYDVNPVGANRLRPAVAKSHQALRHSDQCHHSAGAVCRNSEITREVRLASACLPTMFQAIEIERNLLGRRLPR